MSTEGRGGPLWETTGLGLERLRDLIVEAGASPESLGRMLDALSDASYTVTAAPMAVVWGSRP